MFRQRTPGLLALVLCIVGLGACATTPQTPTAKEHLRLQSETALTRFKEKNADMKTYIDHAYGYVIFPSVTKGAAGVGGAYGRGMVYEKGRFIGYADVSQGTIGPQLGGQEYSEIILFEDKAALERFKAGSVEFAAQASAIAAESAASSAANYEQGVMVFSMGNGGLMFEASIGGQKFTYAPAEAA